MFKNKFGSRKYQCADCKSCQMETKSSMNNRCKTRCRKCGSTFLEPYSEGAKEDFTNAGEAKIILEPTNGVHAMNGRETSEMSKRIK